MSYFTQDLDATIAHSVTKGSNDFAISKLTRMSTLERSLSNAPNVTNVSTSRDKLKRTRTLIKDLSNAQNVKNISVVRKKQRSMNAYTQENSDI